MLNELAVLEPQQIVDVAESALSVDQIVKRRDLITNCMARAMKENQHYGKVPGCGDKPTLLQPGAQLLAHLFRLRPEYEIIDTDLPNGHKRFRVTCRLFFIGSQPEIKIAEGVGESSSMESKHRFRNAAAEIEETGQSLPKTFWTWREQLGDVEAKKKLGEAFDGQNVGPKKVNGSWMVVIYKGGSDEKIENQNPADVFNTVLKIAKKRAFVDATITATASSDFFTQDLEDIRENIEAVTTKVEIANVDKGSRAQNSTAEGVTNWRNVECTFGKKAGPLRGKKLGELNPSNLKYLAEMFLVEGKDVAPKDRKMMAALAIWQSEGKAPESDIPKFNGKNHEELYERLVWENVNVDHFMATMKTAKALPDSANNFANMSDETAARFVGDIDNVLEMCGVKKA